MQCFNSPVFKVCNNHQLVNFLEIMLAAEVPNDCRHACKITFCWYLNKSSMLINRLKNFWHRYSCTGVCFEVLCVSLLKEGLVSNPTAAMVEVELNTLVLHLCTQEQQLSM